MIIGPIEPVVIFTGRYNSYSIFYRVMIMLLKENLIDVWYTGDKGEITDVIEISPQMVEQGELAILAFMNCWVFSMKCDGYTGVGYTNPF